MGSSKSHEIFEEMLEKLSSVNDFRVENSKIFFKFSDNERDMNNILVKGTGNQEDYCVYGTYHQHFHKSWNFYNAVMKFGGVLYLIDNKFLEGVIVDRDTSLLFGRVNQTKPLSIDLIKIYFHMTKEPLFYWLIKSDDEGGLEGDYKAVWSFEKDFFKRQNEENRISLLEKEIPLKNQLSSFIELTSSPLLNGSAEFRITK